jgi:hypothetical protein
MREAPEKSFSLTGNFWACAGHWPRTTLDGTEDNETLRRAAKFVQAENNRLAR